MSSTHLHDPELCLIKLGLAASNARAVALAETGLADIPAARLAQADELYRLKHGTPPLPPATRLPEVEAA